jgi:outer membrane protein assembly factor BamB
MRRFGWLFAAGLLVAGTARGTAGDWPSWRGPTGQGVSDEKGLPLHWDGKSGKNVRWKVPLPGHDGKAQQDNNQSSPVVRGGLVFVTASYWPAGVERTKAYPEHHVVCYRAGDGRVLWDRQVPHGPWLLRDLRGGYTAPTPAADAERVYVMFGSSVLAALDHAGKLVWRKEIVPYDFDVAAGSSPLLYRDTVLLQCDQINRKARLLAFDRRTGEVKWERKRPDLGFTHSTPVLVKVNGRTQLLVAASNAVQGTDPDDGMLLWWCQTAGDTASPVYGDGLVYCDGGRGGMGVAVEPTGSGDVTRTLRRWKVDQVPQGFSSPVVVGEYLYRLCDPQSLKCWKMATGEAVFTRRFPGVEVRASPFTTPEGRIYLASAGKTYVLQAGPKPEVLAVNDLGDASPASAAVAGGRIYLKGERFLYCIGGK